MTEDQQPASETDAPHDPSRWRSRIAASKRTKREFLADWQTNVDYRRGKPFNTDSDVDRISVNQDWPMTKAKQAQLFSQVPEVVLETDYDEYRSAVYPFGRYLNKQIETCGAAAAMFEMLPDVINKAGIGAICVSYEALTDTAMLPSRNMSHLPKPMQDMALQLGIVKMVPTKRVRDARFRWRRVDPDNLLWPSEFRGSDFNEAPWIGESGKCTWAEGKRWFSLKDEDKERVLSSPEEIDEDVDGVTDSNDVTRENSDHNYVHYDQIFYKRYLYHEGETSFCSIQRVVFVRGITDPAINELWKGQKLSSDGMRYVGSLKFPIQVCTLAFMSDDAVPPSDSSIIRPQVDEKIKSRSQMMLQREHSQPLRWADTNRIDPTVLDQIMNANYNGIVLVQGDGQKILGEVPRAQYPRENWEFDNVINQDLRELSQVGENQSGSISSGETSASEARIVQSNFQTRIGVERGRVTTTFLNCVEVLAGLASLYGTFEVPEVPVEQAQRMQQGWDRQMVGQKMVFSVRPGATILLDAEQEIQRLMRYLNMTAKSGRVDIGESITRITELHGLDPAKNVTPPPQPKPEPPNVSFRFSGEDLQQAMPVAILLESGQGPKPESLQAARTLLSASATPVGGAPPQAPPAPGPAGDTPPGGPPPDLPLPGGANPDYTTMPLVETRREA
jgi:hypothetical protein